MDVLAPRLRVRGHLSDTRRQGRPARCDAGPSRAAARARLFRIREASMSVLTSYRRGLLVAGSFVVLATAVLPLSAQQQPPAPSSAIPPMSAGRPGFSPT